MTFRMCSSRFSLPSGSSHNSRTMRRTFASAARILLMVTMPLKPPRTCNHSRGLSIAGMYIHAIRERSINRRHVLYTYRSHASRTSGALSPERTPRSRPVMRSWSTNTSRSGRSDIFTDRRAGRCAARSFRLTWVYSGSVRLDLVPAASPRIVTQNRFVHRKQYKRAVREHS